MGTGSITHTSIYSFNRAQLRLIAMSTMLIDHIGLHLIGNEIVFRTIGRIAFPVYAFLLADGFMHVKDEKAHVGRRFLIMLALTAISEFAYDFARSGLDTTAYMDKQSVMAALTLGYAGMYITDRLLSGDSVLPRSFGGASAAAISLLLCFASKLIAADYGFAGPFFVIASYWYIRIFHINAENENKRLLFLYGIAACYLAYRIGTGIDQNLWQTSPVMCIAFYSGYLYAPPIITAYNGKRGSHTRAFNMLYTAFYPAHLLLVGLLKFWLA